MLIKVKPVTKIQDGAEVRYYEAKAGKYMALGYSHYQAFSNLLGVLFLNHFNVYGDQK